MFAKIGVTSAVVLSLLFFIAQTLIAQQWFKFYKRGPFQWLWRSIAKLQFLSNKRS